MAASLSGMTEAAELRQQAQNGSLSGEMKQDSKSSESGRRDPNWHIDFMADERNLFLLWKAADFGNDTEEHDEKTIDAMYTFLVRTWPVEGDIDSLDRYVQRCQEFMGRADFGNTFLRRLIDYVPPMIARVRETEAERDRLRAENEALKAKVKDMEVFEEFSNAFANAISSAAESDDDEEAGL